MSHSSCIYDQIRCNIDILLFDELNQNRPTWKMTARHVRHFFGWRRKCSLSVRRLELSKVDEEENLHAQNGNWPKGCFIPIPQIYTCMYISAGPCHFFTTVCSKPEKVHWTWKNKQKMRNVEAHLQCHLFRNPTTSSESYFMLCSNLFIWTKPRQTLNVFFRFFHYHIYRVPQLQ